MELRELFQKIAQENPEKFLIDDIPDFYVKKSEGGWKKICWLEDILLTQDDCDAIVAQFGKKVTVVPRIVEDAPLYLNVVIYDLKWYARDVIETTETEKLPATIKAMEYVLEKELKK